MTHSSPVLKKIIIYLTKSDEYEKESLIHLLQQLSEEELKNNIIQEFNPEIQEEGIYTNIIQYILQPNLSAQAWQKDRAELFKALTTNPNWDKVKNKEIILRKKQQQNEENKDIWIETDLVPSYLSTALELNDFTIIAQLLLANAHQSSKEIIVDKEYQGADLLRYYLENNQIKLAQELIDPELRGLINNPTAKLDWQEREINQDYNALQLALHNFHNNSTSFNWNVFQILLTHPQVALNCYYQNSDTNIIAKDIFARQLHYLKELTDSDTLTNINQIIIINHISNAAPELIAEHRDIIKDSPIFKNIVNNFIAGIKLPFASNQDHKLGQLQQIYLLYKSLDIELTDILKDDNTNKLSLKALKGQIFSINNKDILLKGGFINEKDNTEGTALIYAAENGHIEVVKEILAIAKDALTPKQLFEIIYIINNCQKFTALICAAKNGHINIVKEILALARDILTQEQLRNIISIQDSSKNSVLAYSVKIGPEIFKEIFAVARDTLTQEQLRSIINIQDSNNNSILDKAVKNGHAKIILAILDGIKDKLSSVQLSSLLAAKDKLSPVQLFNIIIAKDNLEFTAFDMAVRNNDAKLVKKMLDIAGDTLTTQQLSDILNKKDNLGFTAYDIAIRNNYSIIAKEIIYHKLNILINQHIEAINESPLEKDFRVKFHDFLEKKLKEFLKEFSGNLTNKIDQNTFQILLKKKIQDFTKKPESNDSIVKKKILARIGNLILSAVDCTFSIGAYPTIQIIKTEKGWKIEHTNEKIIDQDLRNKVEDFLKQRKISRNR